MAFSFKSSGQDIAINEEAVRLFREIKTALCNNDTGELIILLEKMEQHFPDDAMILYTNKILGDLYIAQKKVDTALVKLRYAFHYTPKSKLVLLAGETPCDSIYRRQFVSYSKADVCLSLSRAFISQGRRDSSLHYLQLADGVLNPYRGCGNGTKTYQSYLSSFIADDYLALGDTSQAINRLLDFFLEWNGDMKAITERETVMAEKNRNIKGRTGHKYH